MRLHAQCCHGLQSCQLLGLLGIVLPGTKNACTNQLGSISLPSLEPAALWRLWLAHISDPLPTWASLYCALRISPTPSHLGMVSLVAMLMYTPLCGRVRNRRHQGSETDSPLGAQSLGERQLLDCVGAGPSSRTGRRQDATAARTVCLTHTGDSRRDLQGGAFTGRPEVQVGIGQAKGRQECSWLGGVCRKGWRLGMTWWQLGWRVSSFDLGSYRRPSCICLTLPLSWSADEGLEEAPLL